MVRTTVVTTIRLALRCPKPKVFWACHKDELEPMSENSRFKLCQKDFLLAIRQVTTRRLDAEIGEGGTIPETRAGGVGCVGPHARPGNGTASRADGK